MNSKPYKLYFVSILSLVVPGISVTIYLVSPINELIYDDLPAFGLPTTANLGRFCWFSFWIVGNLITTSSSKSPVPEPLIAEMG